jgi:hypothetical protein
MEHPEPFKAGRPNIYRSFIFPNHPHSAKASFIRNHFERPVLRLTGILIHKILAAYPQQARRDAYQ